jgi:chromosome segregation ATPase
VHNIYAAAKERESALAEVSKSVEELRKSSNEREAIIAAVSKDIATLRVETSTEMTNMRAGITKLVSEAEGHSHSVQEVMTALSEVQSALEKGGSLSPEAERELDKKLAGLGKRMGGIEENVKVYSERLGKDMEAWQTTLDDDVKTAIEAVRSQTVANSDALSAAAKEIEKLRAAKAAAPPAPANVDSSGGGLARADTIKLIQETIRPDLEALTKRTKAMESAIKSFTEKLESDVELWQVRFRVRDTFIIYTRPNHKPPPLTRSRPSAPR